jgi:serine/threonine protein kinase
MDAANWQRVGEIFDRVVELPPDERSAMLASLCGGDDALRRDVEALLRAAGGQSAFERDVDTVRLELAANWAQEGEIESGIAIGGQVGVWRIVREIGRGGMGVVYLAQDVHLFRPAALKSVPSAMARDELGLQRLRREAQAAAAV